MGWSSTKPQGYFSLLVKQTLLKKLFDHVWILEIVSSNPREVLSQALGSFFTDQKLTEDLGGPSAGLPSLLCLCPSFHSVLCPLTLITALSSELPALSSELRETYNLGTLQTVNWYNHRAHLFLFPVSQRSLPFTAWHMMCWILFFDIFCLFLVV